MSDLSAAGSVFSNKCYCSFDGDADRIVFYTKGDDDSFVLLDGDKITCLLVHTLQTLLSKTG